MFCRPLWHDCGTRHDSPPLLEKFVLSMRAQVRDVTKDVDGSQLNHSGPGQWTPGGAMSYGRRRGKIPPVDDTAPPRVTALRFRTIATEPTTRTTVPESAMDFKLGGFACHFDDGLLTAAPAEPFSSVQAARQAIRPYLRSWVAWLQTVRGVALDLSFVSADRGADTAGPTASRAVVVIGRARPEDPKLEAPPAGIAGTSEVIADLISRWREVLEGGESTSAGAYHVLSVLEHRHNGRDGVARTLQVSLRLLQQLGRLTAIGNARSGRKMGGSLADQRPLAATELNWIEGLIHHLLVRAFVIDVGGTINKGLTAADYSLDTATYHMSVGQTAKVAVRFVE